MAEVEIITEQVPPPIGKLSAADVLIAIPTFNNEETIASVLKAARAALLRFPGSKTFIVQVDGGSSDSTLQRAKESVEDKEAFAQVSYPLYPVHLMEISHHSVPGKNSAYRTIFSLADEIGAKACCIVGGDVAAITPAWIASLVQPVLEMNFDLAAPFYKRHKFDGLLVTGILYPVMRSLFGKRIRQPIGSDFGYSRALIRQCLALEAWNSESARRDVDLWVTIQAMQSEMKLCQVNLGSRPTVRKDAALDVSTILAHLAGALYIEMEQTAEVWQRIRASSPVPAFGLRFDPENEAPVVDVKPLIDTFRIGCGNLEDIWSLILPPAVLLDLRRMSRQTDHDFHFSDELWARTVYDFGIAHHLRSIGRDHLLRALTPLYMGWIASFISSLLESDANGVEQRTEKLCMTYESQKPYLISRWRWPDRFMP
jgi:glucosylglycerate synthase